MDRMGLQSGDTEWYSQRTFVREKNTIQWGFNQRKWISNEIKQQKYWIDKVWSDHNWNYWGFSQQKCDRNM